VPRQRTRLTTYAAAALLLRLADEGARVALALLGLQRTESPAAGGALVAALLAPHVVAAPLVGAVADRARYPERLIALAALGLAGSLAGAAATVGRAPLAAPVALLVAGGCCGSALTGVLSSRLPHLVDPSRVARAFGLDSLTYNVAGVLGPAVAAAVAGRSSATAGTYVLAGSATAGAQVFAVGAGAKMTATAVGAAMGGALAGAPSAAQLLLAGAWPAVAGGVGLAVLRPRVRSGTRRRPG
jgi:MFS family permease